MKVFVFTIFLTLISVFIPAAILTVDNNLHPTGQYTSWNAAYSAAQDGDIIQIYPSPYYYGNFNVGKRLTVVGGGFNPGNPGLLKSQISLYVQDPGGEDCLFSGIQLLDGVSSSYRLEYSNCIFNGWVSLAASDSKLSYCQTKEIYVGNNTTFTNGFLINGCIIESSFKPVSLTDATCTNCVFVGNVTHIDCFINNQISCFFKNCLFVNSGIGGHSLSAFYSSPVNLMYLNCIVEDCYIAPGQTIQYSIFEGNSANFTGTGNQQSVNLANVMIDVNGGNYHLCTGSLAQGTGYNGEDIGVYGGDTPFNDLWYLTHLPSITDFSCPIIVDENGLLDVHVEAQAGN